MRDLSALRVGPNVDLRFTAPDETTDHQPLLRKGLPVPMTAVVCRMQGAACLGIARLAVSPGEAVTTADTLPPPLTVGPGRPVAYRVRVENAAGRDAGPSREALAAAGTAPAGVAGLVATTVANGVQLTWQTVPDPVAPVRVEALGEPATASEPPSFGKAPVRAGGTSRLLQVPGRGPDSGGAVDPAPAAGERVTYRVYRQRTVQANGQSLPLSGPVATVSVVRARDVFPPAPPAGPLAVSFQAGNAGASVSLSWEPNSEPDVVGYRVYRATGTGAWQRLTEKPVAGVSFEDSAATGLLAGAHVRYAVTAVDRNGNESARSAVTEVDVR